MSHHTPITAIARIALLAGILLAILLLPTRAYQPAHAQDAVNETFYYAENRTDEVVSYTATDPEGVDITWTRADADNGTLDFSIKNGELKFTTQPDYEAPKGGQNNSSNTYRVALTAWDGATDSNDNPINQRTWTVTVIVTDVEEAGTVSLSGLRPLERKSFTATLDDPDGGSGDSIPLTITTDDDQTDLTADTTTKWQWARSTSKTGPWTDIKDATGSGNNGKSYTPDKDDLGHYLRATATYTDRRGENKTASAVSAYAVQKNLVNDAPEFQDSEGNAITATTRSVAENSPAGTLVGAAVTAHDDENDVLTYKISDGDTNDSNHDDVAPFDFNTASGQISVKDPTKLDFEFNDTDNVNNTKKEYKVDVTATDPSGTSTTVTVTINVTDVSEAPKFTEEANTNAISISKPEDTAITEVLSTYKATDDEDKANISGYSLYWSLSGDDKDDFQLCSNENINCGGYPSNPNNIVQLRFKAKPDYEAAADKDTNNKYQVTVEAYDSIGKKASLDVTVTVTNDDEDGTVTLSGSSSGLQPRLQPQADTTIYAHLSDPDGVKSGTVKWQWKTSGDHDGSGGIPTEGIVKSTKPSTSNSYKPTADDVDKFLWAIATYTDNQGANKMATSKQPTTGTDNYKVKVKNQYCTATSTAGTVNNQKQYRCSSVKDGNKAPTFPNTHDTTRSLTEGTLNITPDTAVTATDAANTSCDVTKNFYDDGCLNLTSARSTVTNGTDLLATSTVTETDRLTYSLEGNDASKFDIDIQSGQLSLDTPLDFENPTDRGKDNTYNVTVKATDPSGKSDTIAITIEVTNDAGEAPKITGGATAISTPEGTLTTKVLSTYTATDDEDDNDDDANSIVSWKLSGSDNDDFQLCDSDGSNCHDTNNTGGAVQLRFKTSPDYENPADSDTADNVYNVTLTATDSDSNDSTVRNVTVRVTNVDETEAVTLSANQPKEGVPLTATLADVPDLVTENTVTWQWARSTSQSGPWTDIANANATQDVTSRTSTYTATTTDMGSYLRATAAYTDGHGPGKTGSAVSVHPVSVKQYLNKAPVFDAPVSTDDQFDYMTSRSVPENSSAGTAVGAAVAATDIGRNGRQEVLTYELLDDTNDDGADNDHFDFNTQTGPDKRESRQGAGHRGHVHVQGRG